MGTDGFEFVEYTAPDPGQLGALFEQMGFTAVARHRSKDVILYRQGRVNFIVNREPDSFAQSFARVHGPSACAFAIRVRDAAKAYHRALELGAKPSRARSGRWSSTSRDPGIGGSLIYLIDRPGNGGNLSIYDVDFVPSRARRSIPRAQPRGDRPPHAQRLSGAWTRGRSSTRSSSTSARSATSTSRQEDRLTSRALTSPCGKIRIPINEPSDKGSQIQEYLDAYHGEGIQHIALSCENIYETVEKLRGQSVRFLDTPDTYYDRVDARVKDHGEDLARMKKNRILLDGEGVDKDHQEDKLLQIFTETVIGPIFFEIIQRKGNEGFGEGNFRALFESIEADQIARGVV